jgi:hypothetical protein
MIGLSQLVSGVLMGCLLMALGLVPGLYKALGEGVLLFAERITFQSPAPARLQVKFEQPRLFATVGVVLIGVTLAAYLAN